MFYPFVGTNSSKFYSLTLRGGMYGKTRKMMSGNGLTAKDLAGVPKAASLNLKNIVENLWIIETDLGVNIFTDIKTSDIGDNWGNRLNSR